MNRELTNGRLRPHSAIIVYKSGGDYSSSYYLETRDIVSKGKQYEFGSPVPMSDDKMKDIAAAYIKKASADMIFEGIIPEHFLYANHKASSTVVIWWRKPQRKQLNFSAGLKIKGKPEVMLPATLYMVHNNQLYVFALMDGTRPVRSTKLYHAPFYNIYEGGHVCLGSAPVGRYKSKSFEGEAERFERGFFMAEQNQVHNRPCKTPLAILYNGLIKNKAKSFPAKQELQQHKKFPTLGDLMDKIIGNTKQQRNENIRIEEED